MLSAVLAAGTLTANARRAEAQVRAEAPAAAQSVISGVVTDPSGAVVRGAAVSLIGADGAIVAHDVSGPLGTYQFDVTAGTYRVRAEADGFAMFESKAVEAASALRAPGSALVRVDITLKIAGVVEQVDVPEAVVEGARSGRDVVLHADDVKQMPLDPVALLNELTGLAGNASAQIFVDGFSGAKLPSRDSIREIRINENPYSAENDTDTVNAVIRVLTQPGGSALHGQLYLYGDTSALNARNPFAPHEPAYYADGAGGDFSDSIGRNLTAYLRVDELQQKTNAAISALVLDNSLQATSAQYTVPNPKDVLDIAARTDARLRPNNTLVLRYTVDRTRQNNVGAGQLSLASQGLNNTSFVHTLQAGDTIVLGPRMVEETRAQYIRTRSLATPVSTMPTVVVQGAFAGGGSSQGLTEDHQDRAELQEYLSIALRQHFLYMGGRLRFTRDANRSHALFNGEYIFPTLHAYQVTLAGEAAGLSAAQIAADGGGASQYVVAAGNPRAEQSVLDGAVFLQDNWKARQNLRLSYGLRFETQNRISDHADWAPRVGFTWGLGAQNQAGGAARYVVHGGAGIFYQRFETADALRVNRFNGVREQQYVVQSPQFCGASGTARTMMSSAQGCAAPSIAVLQSQSPVTVYRINSRFVSPYFVEGSIGIDRQLGTHGVAGVNYLNSRGMHTQYLENANAPLPATYTPGNAASGTRPEGNGLNAYEYESDGRFRTQQVTSNFTYRHARFTLTGNYILQFSKSNAENNGTFPLNRFDLGADYGRSALDVRHAATVTGSVDLPHGFSSWAYLRATSGAPFNFVVGDDLNGDTQYNDRPAFATDLTRASVVRTRWGALDTRPLPNQTLVPRNFGEGPGTLMLNLAAGKTVGFGRRGDPGAGANSQSGERRFSAELWVLALNVLNHPNFAPPVAVVDSPLFGQSVGVVSAGSLAPSRAIDMQLSVRF